MALETRSYAIFSSIYFCCKVLFCLNHLIPVSGFSFVGTDPFRFVYIELEGTTDLNISCLTTDMTANVSLWFRGKLLMSDRISLDKQIFTIHNISPADSGSYDCKARNSLGVTIDQTVLRFIKKEQLPGPVTITDHIKVIATGASTNFTCKVDMSNSIFKYLTLEWYRREGGDYKAVPDSETQRKASSLTLMIQNAKATVTNGTSYKCQMHYRKISDFAYSLLLVKDLSVPNITLIKSAVVNELKELKVKCLAAGFPAPTITWLRNGTQMSLCQLTLTSNCNGQNYQERKFHSNQNGVTESSLIILKTRYPTDHGKYTCSAENSNGKNEGSVEVYVHTAPRLDKTNLIFIRTENKIFCDVIGYPIPVFKWKYQFAVCLTENFLDCVPRKDKWVDLPGKHVVSADTSLEKQKSTLTIPDSVQFGFYKCIATNILGRDANVLKFYGGGVSNKIEITAKSSMFDEDTTLTVECYMFIKGSVIGWLKDGKRLSFDIDDRVNITEGEEDKWTWTRLKVERLTLQDAGLYMCITQDSSGRPMNASKEFTISKVFPPRILSFPNRTIFGVKSVELFCNISANTSATVSWFKDGSSLANMMKQLHQSGSLACDTNKLVQGFYCVKTNPEILLICNPVHNLHTGEYMCQATNRKGNATASAYVDVLERPRIVGFKPYEEQGSKLGETINITCEATGNPEPMVQWKRGVENEPVTIEVASEAQLLIASVTDDDFGNYTCVAFNSKGTTFATMKIVKEPGSPAPRELPNNLPKAVVIAISVVGSLAFLFIVFAIVCCFFFRHQRKQVAELRSQFFPDYTDSYKLDPDLSLLEQCNALPYDPGWEFPEERLILGDVLGSGAFGQVIKAEAIGIVDFTPRDKSVEKSKRRSKMLRRSSSSKMYQDSKGNSYTKTIVAVKTLKEGASRDEYKDLASELKILIHIGEHKNIVNLLGACTRGQRLLVIMEYAPHGNLLKFLRDKRDIYDPTWTKTTDNPDVEFTIANLVAYTYQIARGMEFLASKKCIHRDLAARNVLVGEDYVMKIADFGLARDVYKADLYVKTTSGVLPVKWMALESLFDRVYTEKSDVWSFGICLWEIFTLGGTPYPGVPTEELLDFLSDGARMKQPQNCPLEMYAIMRDSWEQDPGLRPTFSMLSVRIGRILELRASKQSSSAYISFTQDKNERGGQDYFVGLLDSASAVPQEAATSGINRNNSNPEPEVEQDEAQPALGRESSGSWSGGESGIELEESLREADDPDSPDAVVARLLPGRARQKPKSQDTVV